MRRPTVFRGPSPDELSRHARLARTATIAAVAQDSDIHVTGGAPPGKRSLTDTAVLNLLPRGGRPGLEVAVRLDLLRSLGVRNVWRRLRDEARLAAIRSDGKRLG
jgi:hypothetical protein